MNDFSDSNTELFFTCIIAAFLGLLYISLKAGEYAVYAFIAFNALVLLLAMAGVYG